MRRPPQRLPHAPFALHQRVADAVRVENVPLLIGDVDGLGGAFVEIGLPRQAAELGQIARLQSDVEIAGERQRVTRIDEYGGERVEYVAERVDGDSAIVKAQIVTKSGTTVPIESRVNQRGGRWLIYDILIENVSLVGNYRSQFDRIIRTSSYDELVRRLKERVVQLSDKPATPAKPSAPRPR